MNLLLFGLSEFFLRPCSIKIKSPFAKEDDNWLWQQLFRTKGPGIFNQY